MGLPDDLRLRVALTPVSGLWERLNGWQQDQVEVATKMELARLAGLLVQPETAPRLPADRLTDRRWRRPAARPWSTARTAG
ncbi:hypothetical protein GCM10010211_11830 [Streptomyces albospinus]|uniref:Uncharacterized protein n=1 Tax=Streptomyces albospinus TaxID=285515 RepID=A0ABQ2UQR9_9ACTN|nr:hypothetical protein [Streptomyces albospinus]GGU49319.1 hypothetical protein GCM10010211_11830 [Streptomyces albospinus]